MKSATSFAFLHGGGQGGWVWEKAIAALHKIAPGTPALALDVPGCGKKRGRNTARLDNIDVARDLVQDIEHAALTNVVLVGHSQAGQVIPFMAAQRPDLFAHLVYVSCSMPKPGQTVLEMMGTGSHGSNEDEVGYPPALASTDIRSRFAELFCNDMPPDQETPFLASLGPDNWPMKTYSFADWPTETPAFPATYILCLRDKMLPPAWQERFAERLGALRIIRIDTGHQPMITAPYALAEMLLQTAAKSATVSNELSAPLPRP